MKSCEQDGPVVHPWKSQSSDPGAPWQGLRPEPCATSPPYLVSPTIPIPKMICLGAGRRGPPTACACQHNGHWYWARGADLSRALGPRSIWGPWRLLCCSDSGLWLQQLESQHLPVRSFGHSGPHVEGAPINLQVPLSCTPSASVTSSQETPVLVGWTALGSCLPP